MGGLQGTSKFPGLSAYSASKAALANLTECLAEELKADGIRVNCLALGSVNTEMLQEAFPAHKAPVDPDEIAKFIVYFSEHAGMLMNGKIILFFSVMLLKCLTTFFSILLIMLLPPLNVQGILPVVSAVLGSVLWAFMLIYNEKTWLSNQLLQNHLTIKSSEQ